jgi:SAM-dependent methyltransferase
VRAFDELVTAATSAPIAGWDFSWLAARSSVDGLPWSYRRVVAQHAAAADTMLDMGTGGGEQLSEISARPRHTVATEAWPPNVSVAAERLRPLGIPVVLDEGSPDNTAEASEDRGRMPFRTGAFALVINRHEAFRASEVARVLAPGGTFITQQVDFHSYDGLYELLGLEVPVQPETWLPVARQQVVDAGLTVQQAVRGEERTQFHDVAAVIYYLRVVGWAVPEFSLDAHLARLRAAHDNIAGWPLTLRLRRFLLVATKQA